MSFFEASTHPVFQPDPSATFMDAFAVDPEGSGRPDFILTSLGMPLGKPARLRWLKNDGGGRFVDGSKLLGKEIQTWHPRHLVAADFDGDGTREILIADHGVDLPPFPGSRPILLAKRPDGKWYDESSRRFLGDAHAFTFNLAAGDLAGRGRTDAYFSNVSEGGRPGPAIWLNDGRGRFSRARDALPGEFDDVGRFLASTIADLDGDGRPELVLGGLDRRRPASRNAHDRILARGPDGRWRKLPPRSLPARKGGSTWGTVEIVPADLAGSGRPDLLALVHNHGFSRASLQLHVNQGGLRFRKSRASIPYRQEPGTRTFIPWADVADVDGDGRLDILCVLRMTDAKGRPPRQTVKLFLNRGNERFVDASETLPVQGTFFVGAKFLDFDEDGRMDIFLMGYDGSYTLLRNTGKLGEFEGRRPGSLNRRAGGARAPSRPPRHRR